jgi:hypothetical protein
MTATSLGKTKADQDSQESSDEPAEPERNFDKLKARIKLRAIKKFTEDDERRKNKEFVED